MTYPVTPSGLADLKQQLQHLKSHERPRVIKDIEEARAHGDLKENAEYDAAKNKQGFIEAKIRDIGSKIAQAQVIDPSTLSGDKVVFGATVTIYDIETEEEKTYTIVGEHESDIQNGKISIFSPFARALIGHNIGDEVTITTPQKTVTCEIANVSFA